MLLKDRITEDMKNAMRTKETQRLGTLRLLLAACKQKEVDERIVLDDHAVIGILDKLIKQRKDSIAAFELAARQDLAEIEAAELQILQAYLPQRMSAQEIQEKVQSLITQLSQEWGRAVVAADMGKVMGVVKAELANKADMATVSASVKALLAH